MQYFTSGRALKGSIIVTRHSQLRKLAGILVAASLVAAVAPMADASTPTTLSSLVANADKDVTAIRQFYFCQTVGCRAAKTAQSAAALAGTKNLETLAKAASSMVLASDLQSALTNFRIDVTRLTNAIGDISSQTSNTTKTIVVGIVYYESAYVQTDVYVLAQKSAHRSVRFKEWGIGVVAATQTLQVDIQLETPKATTGELIACNQGLELIAQGIRAHLNSPAPVFNAKLRSLAQVLTTYSAQAINLLKVQGTPAQRSALAATLKSFFAQFQSVTTLQNQLAK